LFILVVEGLSRLIPETKRMGEIRGIRVGGSVFLSHLLFVDDIFLFIHGSLWEMHNFKGILDTNCNAMGM
jgi:hypothetical protein